MEKTVSCETARKVGVEWAAQRSRLTSAQHLSVMRRSCTVRTAKTASAFPAARCRSFATKAPNPRVFFDVSIKNTPKGRISFEVLLYSHVVVPLLTCS